MSSPTAKTRAQVAAELAGLRAAQPPLTEARRAEIEAHLAAADVRPDLQAVWEEDPTLKLGLLLLDPAVARAAAPLLRRKEPLPTPGPLGLILTIVSASDVAALAADLGLPLPPAGPGLPLLFDVEGLRGSRRLFYVIFDQGDETYYTGGGRWTADPEEALRHNSEGEAQAEVEEVDCDAILRDRLVVRPILSTAPQHDPAAVDPAQEISPAPSAMVRVLQLPSRSIAVIGTEGSLSETHFGSYLDSLKSCHATRERDGTFRLPVAALPRFLELLRGAQVPVGEGELTEGERQLAEMIDNPEAVRAVLDQSARAQLGPLWEVLDGLPSGESPQKGQQAFAALCNSPAVAAHLGVPPSRLKDFGAAFEQQWAEVSPLPATDPASGAAATATEPPIVGACSRCGKQVRTVAELAADLGPGASKALLQRMAEELRGLCMACAEAGALATPSSGPSPSPAPEEP